MKSYLIYGFKASGKTTHGIKLAKELNLLHIDLDQEILKDYSENSTKSSSAQSIFDLYNALQDKFREIEYIKFLNIIKNHNNIILSVGGSTLLNKEINIKKLKKEFEFIFIDTDFDIIYERIQNQKTIYKNYSYDELKSIYDKRIAEYCKYNLL